MLKFEWIAGRRMLVSLLDPPVDIEERREASIGQLQTVCDLDLQRILADLFSEIETSLTRTVLESDRTVGEVAASMISYLSASNRPSKIKKYWADRTRAFRKAQNRLNMLIQYAFHKSMQRAVIDYGEAVSEVPG